ncbi:MAG: ferritin [Candidatus Saccharicenans sp.]|nr:ferritin [Candidatus Saccharicenans sp.]MDH7492671.1 ferritin [Candidatus Saccharicenans sp.]
MISQKMAEAINKQINEEMYSAYLYLSMAGYFAEQNLMGFHHWLLVQYHEELSHAEKFYKYLIERGGQVRLTAIKEPEKTWKSPKDAFEAVLKHEQHITGKINELVDLAEAEKDRATFAMLQWFVNEQVEEEANAQEIVAKLEMVGDHKQGLLMLDRALTERKKG